MNSTSCPYSIVNWSNSSTEISPLLYIKTTVVAAADGFAASPPVAAGASVDWDGAGAQAESANPTPINFSIFRRLNLDTCTEFILLGSLRIHRGQTSQYYKKEL